ncbi:MAG: OsmC family peroxiredoxin [Acidimicrobiia bacterium]
MKSNATTTWTGDLASGSGTASLATGVATALPVTWASRTEAADGKTSPEELIAAAHSACYSMALSAGLAGAGHAPEKLVTEAEVTFDQKDGNWTVISSHLHVTATVPGIDSDAFAEQAQHAKDGCPVSRALAGNVEITLEAELS